MALQINPNVSLLRCSWSGQELPGHPFSSPVGLCRCCPAARQAGGGRVRHCKGARPSCAARRSPGATGQGSGGTLRCYRCSVSRKSTPRTSAHTPTVRHGPLSRQLGVEVFLKNEGTNPSGSFKDRGLAVGVALGRACGARRFCLPTQGNAGVAACLFSARLGMPGCQVWMPEGFQGSIYRRGCEFFGGEVRFAGPNIAATGRAMRERLAHELSTGEYVDISTFFEPGRLEGKKTMGLEIADQFAGRRLPDLVVYPTGGGTGLVGIWKAFTELSALGLLERHARADCRVWWRCSRSTALRLSRRSTKASTRSCR